MTTATPETREKIHGLIAQHCFTRELPERYVQMLVEHADVRAYQEGAVLFTEGMPADRFHLIVSGRVAILMHVPGRGDQVVDTVEDCETAGWSWLVPPYRWFFDARAVTDVLAVTVDAKALRALCDDDPAFGYLLLQRVTQVMLERMQAARIRLADVYGTGPS
jgi:CRP-like cAMP-binding protein